LGSNGNIVFLAVNASYSHTNLAGWYLREYALSAGWNWQEVEVTRNDSISTALQHALRLNPDALAASFYLFNSQFLLSFISRFKALQPDCPVIGGGPEFLGDNFPFLDRHPEINAVIRGEGERAFAAWLDLAKNPEKWGTIRGLCAVVGGKYIDNGQAELIKNLDEIPSPYECGLMCRNVGNAAGPESLALPIPVDSDRGRAAAPRNAGRASLFTTPGAWPRRLDFTKPFLLLETSRGCSNQCAFCTSAGEPVRIFSLERVRRDISLISAAGVREIRLADRTFNENQKRCLELVKIMRDEFKGVKFHLEIDPARVTDELALELGKAEYGKFHLEAGIQTTHAGALRGINRSGSVERALAGLQKLCSLRNLAVHVDLIAGLPRAGLADLYADLRTVALMEPDEIQLELLKVLPGTRLSGEKDKFGIISSGETPYEVLRTATMSFDDLVKARRLSSLVDWFYNSTELQTSFSAAVKLIPDFFERFADFTARAAGENQAPALDNRFRMLEQFFSLNAPALVHKLGYAWLKCGLSAQHGICRTTQWKNPLPEDAVLVEGDSRAAAGESRRMYLAELERPYIFIYGEYPRRQAGAVYALKDR